VKKTFTGKTIEEAVDAAAKELGLSKDDFSYEITELPKKGFLGIGSAPAKITVNYEVSTEDKVEEYLTGLFKIVGLDGCKTSITVEGDNVSIKIDGDAADIFVQKQGEAIEALQWIIALSLNRENDTKYKVTLNINDYREKTKERLEALAVKVAKQVQKSHRRVTLNPMSAYQRRIIHTRLQDEANITTYSIGNEPNRKVVVSYQGENGEQRYQKKPQNKNGYRKNNRNNSEKTGSDAETGVTEITFVEGEKRAPRNNSADNSNEKRGGYERKNYNKKSYSDRPRQQRNNFRSSEQQQTATTEPTVELRAGEKRAQKPENN